MKKILSFLSCRLVRRCPGSGRIIGLNIGWPLLFPILGMAALIWSLVRIVAKPSRAAYPCMRVAVPMASSFLAWLLGITGASLLVKRLRTRFDRRKYAVARLLLSGIVLFVLTTLSDSRLAISNIALDYKDPYGPNVPVGEAKGIFPGRVVWAWNPDATNENCQPDRWGDAYFLDKNCNQDVVDDMLSKALLQLTGEETGDAAWDAVFRYFNRQHNKGDVGYTAGETIFIKINAVHAWTTNKDGSIRNDDDYGNVDTSPQAVLAMLRQLVRNAGVPQDNIYIGDPYTHVFTHCLEKWRAEFPAIHFMDKSGLDGREKYSASAEYKMHFSDKGSVLSQTQDRYFTVMDEADYLLNIPAMKGHRWGGVTFFGKNFFGANTRSGADHMHPGLHRESYDGPLRGQYGLYRVFVDLLGHENLGGKMLIYLMDALWSCSYEHEPPVKFKMAPFNNDWTSSIFLSLDPLAIESVCLDILQAEFPKQESEVPGNYWYANFPAIDDYLHQAADPANWPEGLTYDPEGDGTPLTSLGVHEHWNDPIEQKYSRDLGTGVGIELLKQHAPSAIATLLDVPARFILRQNHPNPFNSTTRIRYALDRDANVRLLITNATGQVVRTLVQEFQAAGQHTAGWNGADQDGISSSTGIYLCHLLVDDGGGEKKAVKRMLLIK